MNWASQQQLLYDGQWNVTGLYHEKRGKERTKVKEWVICVSATKINATSIEVVMELHH